MPVSTGKDGLNNRPKRRRGGAANRIADGARLGRGTTLAAFLCCLLPAAALGVSVHAENQPIVLYTHDETAEWNGQTQTPADETIQCIAGRLGQTIEIRHAPRLRNRGLLSAGQIDGIFPNLPDPELDEIGVPTEPFVLERWSYIQRYDSQAPDQPDGQIVGVVLGSNESRFLRRNEVNVFDAVPNTESLVKLLVSGRLPYVMADDWRFRAEAAALSYTTEDFNSSVVRYVPLQAYFSKTFAQANPGFIARFNETIGDCVHEGRIVAGWERRVLLTEADKIQSSFGEEIAVRLASSGKLRALDPLPSRIQALEEDDADWKDAMAEDRINALMETLLSNPLSGLLREIAAQHPLVTEIFVTDEDGFIIGLNRLTSDFWQGDEAAAQAILFGDEKRHFSEFEYDLSTRRFQVKLSLPILDPTGEKQSAGMLTIGLDAAAALAGRLH